MDQDREVLETLRQTPIATPIKPSIVSSILSHPPWITTIPGIINFRALEGNIKKNYIFRSGTLEKFTTSEEGVHKLEDLGIGLVFDLRSSRERERNPEVKFGDGIKGVWFEEERDALPEGEEQEEGKKTVRHSSSL